MKKFITTLLAATGLAIATPAPAAPYVEATTSFNNHDASYGAKIGYAIPLLPTSALTLEAGGENFLENITYVGTVGVQARLFGPFSAYGQGGFVNHNGNSGYRLGGGAKVNLTTHIYVKGGYQRDDYGAGHSDAATASLGVQF